MKEITLFIIDDESSARELLHNLLLDEEYLNIIAEAGNVDEAMPLIMKHQPDILLLDIQMPKKDGFVLVEMLSQHNFLPEIIFITAYDQYAIRAIKASAVDYLLKPVSKEDLIKAIEKAAKRLKRNNPAEQYSSLISYLKNSHKIKFKNRTGFIMIDANDIIYCKADSNYSVLKLNNGKSQTVSLNLGKVEELLPENGFCRISRSTIINLNYLTEVDRKGIVCHLNDGDHHILPVSRKLLKILESSCER